MAGAGRCLSRAESSFTARPQINRIANVKAALAPRKSRNARRAGPLSAGFRRAVRLSRCDSARSIAAERSRTRVDRRLRLGAQPVKLLPRLAPGLCRADRKSVG